MAASLVSVPAPLDALLAGGTRASALHATAPPGSGSGAGQAEGQTAEQRQPLLARLFPDGIPSLWCPFSLTTKSEASHMRHLTLAATVLWMCASASGASSSQATQSAITYGPFVGHLTPTSAMVWARCSKPGVYSLTAWGSGGEPQGAGDPASVADRVARHLQFLAGLPVWRCHHVEA